MSFSTYADLTANVATWMARSDLTTYIPDFITLFEAAAARKLRVRPMEASTTLTTSSGTAALPTGYLGYRRATWNGSTNVELTYKHPSMLKALYPTGASGTPKDFTIEASNFVLRPIDDTGVSFLYYAKTAALSGTLNWLYTNHYDAYLFGTMAEAKAFIEDFDEAAIWKQRRDEVFDEISKLNFREPSGLAVQIMGSTP